MEPNPYEPPRECVEPRQPSEEFDGWTFALGSMVIGLLVLWAMLALSELSPSLWRAGFGQG